MSKRVLVSWSTGKDCAWMLHVLRQQRDIELAGLLTTFNESADRVAMHAVRRTLVESQAEAIGLPLWSVDLPWPCSNDLYEQRMAKSIQQAREQGITHVAFGDLHLEDVRDYRIRQLEGTGIEPMFPVWCGPQATRALAERMVAHGFRSVLTCVDPKQLAAEFLGRVFDEDLLRELPESVDSCGERGEFHTFCFEGPIFRPPLRVRIGERVEQDGFLFADVLPESDDCTSERRAR